MSPPERSAAAPRIAILAPSGRDRQLLERLLASQDLPCWGCPSEHELLERLSAGQGPALVAEEGLSAEGVDRLGSLLDAQPPWSDLPLILLTRSATPGGRLMAPLLRRRNVRPLRRPVDTQALLGLARLALESRRRQHEVRDLLERTHRLNRRLARRTEQLQQLTAAVIDAEEREHERLARVLHDDLQQILVGAQLHLATASRQLGNREKLESSLERVRALLSEAQQQSRQLSHELFPAVLQTADLHEVLRWLAGHAEERLGLDVHLRVDGELGELDPGIVRFSYRAALELLCNVAKHSRADQARIRARPRRRSMELEISDEGVGFDPETLERPEPAVGLGLWSIRERAQSLGGALEIASTAGRGSRLTLTLPRTPPPGFRRADAGPAGAVSRPATAPLALEPAPPADDPAGPIDVLLVDDSPVVRRAVTAIVDQDSGVRVAGEADGIDAALAAVERSRPDVLLLDLELGREHGLDLLRRLRERDLRVTALVVSQQLSEGVVREVIGAGAAGFVVKLDAPRHLIPAIRAVRAGARYLSPSAATAR